MKQINLIPPSVRAKAGRESLIVGMALAVVLALGAVAAMRILMTTQAETAASNLDNLKTGQTVSAAKVAVADTDLTTRVDKLNAIAKTETDWSRAFQLVSDILPADIVLSNFSYIWGNNVMTLKFSGTAPTNVSFASFAAGGRADTVRFSSFKVDSYTYDPNKATVTFSITAVVRSTQLTYSKK